MRRRATEDQDNNDHIPQATLNNYNVIDDYNTTSELNRYDDGSGDWDGTSNRITDNAPTGGGDFGFTGDATKINIIPQSTLDNGTVLEYLNGTKVSNIMTSSFNWLVSASNKVPVALRGGLLYNNRVKNTSAGPLGQTHYIKTGYTVILPSPSAASADYASFIGLWAAINNGDITSFKLPIDLISPVGSNKLKDEEIVTTERVSVDLGGGTIIDTTLDLGGGYAAIEETGWWNYDSIDTNKRLDRWKNYYIGGGNNIYISETTGSEGLKALPNFSGIEFTFGITAKYQTDTGKAMLAFAKLPFYIDSFLRIPNSYLINGNTNYVYTLVNYDYGNSWDYKYHESSKILLGATKSLMSNRGAHGNFDFQKNYLKFRMAQ